MPIGCVLLDATGTILQANAVAAARLRRTPRGLIGENFFSAFGLPGGKAAFEAAAAKGAPEPTSLDIDLPDVIVRVRGFALGGDAFALAIFEPAHADARMRRLAEAWEMALETVREVRHEINNPLMGILGQLELLQARGDVTPTVAKKLASIEFESGRIRAMTDRLGAIKRI